MIVQRDRTAGRATVPRTAVGLRLLLPTTDKPCPTRRKAGIAA